MLEKTLVIKETSVVIELEQDLQHQLPGGSVGFDLDKPTKYLGLGGYFNDRLALIVHTAATLINFKRFVAQIDRYEIGLLTLEESEEADWMDSLTTVIKIHARAMKKAHQLLHDDGFTFVLDGSFMVVNPVQSGGYRLTIGYSTPKELEELINDFPPALCRRIRSACNCS